ncbi:uncharacterized protein EHS24_001918 [Apiotrichum porosum]|uniref:Uncharacterized protein n=1 Tax=Apiotrichum porosum TaxID=105984 RepID=A0A427XJM1_9TREE|nr:uncharacterized protein EHS24_001918 [Apiotrichum porosum]RSH78992.1 hypothetical protein EHS24_001918 [Apiotrichum porosum]
MPPLTPPAFSHRTSDTQQPVRLDHTAFPHLLDLIVTYADYSTLLKFRQASGHTKNLAEARIMHHLFMNTARGTESVLGNIPDIFWKHKPQSRAMVHIIDLEGLPHYPLPNNLDRIQRRLTSMSNLDVLRIHNFHSDLFDAIVAPRVVVCFTSTPNFWPVCSMINLPRFIHGCEKLVVNLSCTRRIQCIETLVPQSHMPPSVNEVVFFLHPESAIDYRRLPFPLDAHYEALSDFLNATLVNRLFVDILCHLVALYFRRGLKIKVVGLFELSRDAFWQPALDPQAIALKFTQLVLRSGNLLGWGINYQESAVESLSFMSAEAYCAEVGYETFLLDTVETVQ